AIDRPNQHFGNNELVVANTGVAGLYIDFDYSHQKYGVMGLGGSTDYLVQKQSDYPEVFAAAEEFGMPVFAIKSGVAYEAKPDTINKSLILGRQINPSEM